MSATLPQLNLEKCPHCNVDKPSLHLTSHFQTHDFAGESKRNWGTYVCSRCGGVTTAWSLVGTNIIGRTFPSSQEVDKELPDTAREYLKQAINSISAPAGAVLLAASAVDSMLKAKGLKDGSLYSRINTATEKHLITPDMATWAHEVRLEANSQRHADESVALPTPQDAQRVIDFVQTLGLLLFVLPARVQRGIEAAKNV